MIGFYDYTVVLTYMSLLSAIGGITLVTCGHPILATYCLLFCGLCDMFDGKVARTKKNRTAEEKSYGIQIDSLSDVVAFGVLPATMTVCLCGNIWYSYIVAAFYALAGMIRLAYFNVTEELRQKETDECRKTYLGLPITSASLIFPFFFCIIAVFCLSYDRIELFLELFRRTSLRAALCGLMGITAFAFVFPFRIRKPQSKELCWFLVFGLLIAIVLFIFYLRFSVL